MFQSDAQKRWGTPIIMVRGRSRKKGAGDSSRNGRRFSNLHIIALTILLALMTLSGILAFEWLWGRFSNSSIFTLRGISIQGNRRVSSADILDAANLRVGTDSIHSITPRITEECIMNRSRYLAQVKVWRGLARKEEGILGWATIEVKEKEPVALVDYGKAGSFMIVDNQGAITEEVQCPQHPVKTGAQDQVSSVRYLPVIKVGDRALHGTQDAEKADLGSPSTKKKKENTVSLNSEFPDLESESLNLALDVLAEAGSATSELFNEISYIDARNKDDILLVLDPGYSNIQYPESDKLTVRLASDRITDGMIDILPVIARRKGKQTDPGSPNTRIKLWKSLSKRGKEKKENTGYIDARFPGAVYCIGD